ncbi:MAG TPA: hypothetical protein VFA26_10220 [Gemmataceae bacterium]|nr:hypothetical protein [Gemmataceae bacterium]
MLVRQMVSHVLADEALTRGLQDAEARVLVEWLADRAERIAAGGDEGAAWAELRRLLGRARAIARFVLLWCYQDACGAAGQLAAAERFAWPLPTPGADPCELMQDIVAWETRLLKDAARLARAAG